MDIISHALAGAATGSYYNRPVEGALIAILPDITLFGKRKDEPDRIYKFLHSIWPLWIFLIVSEFTGDLFIFMCWLSHYMLDVPTHKGAFSVRPLYPLYNQAYDGIMEWEWLNKAWWTGLFILVAWMVLWLKVL